CRAGQPTYRAYYKQSGGERRSRLGKSVDPGDLMEIDIVAGGGEVIADITNDTAGWSLGLDAKFSLAPDSGSVMTSQRRSPDGIRPLADFSSIRFART